MTTKVKNLSKMMIVYQMLYMTEKPSGIIQAAIRSLKLSMRKVLTNQEEVYREAEKYQIKLYEDAWKLCFEPNSGYVIEIGTIAGKIYESIDKKEASKYIGSGKMDKVLTSYFIHGKDPDDAYTVESRSTMFAEKIIELYDGKKKITAFQRRMNILKGNKIIETGECWDEFKQK